MRHYLKAARFFYHIRAGKKSSPAIRKRFLPAADGSREADIYSPDPDLCRYAGTLLLVHGMAASGNKDPRIITLGKALARCGYIVVTPLFPDIRAFRIRHQTPDDIAGVIDAVARDPELCPNGRLSIFAPSFSAGMSLIAAARTDVAHRVAAICVVGSYCRVESAIEGLMARQDDDDYGRLIVLKNFLPYRNGLNKKVDAALCAAILDNGLERDVPEFPLHLERLSVADKAELTRLLHDAGYRVDWWRRLIDESSDVREICQQLSVLPRIGHIHAAMAIIHGAGDKVIPCEESVTLHRHLKSLGVPSRLSITGLLSHGDILHGFSLVQELAGVLRTLAFFFKHSERACHKSETTESAFSPAFGDVSIPSEVCQAARISISSPPSPAGPCRRARSRGPTARLSA